MTYSGLILNVYRHGNYDATFNGLSEDIERVVLVDKRSGSLFEATDGRPAVQIVEKPGGYITARPLCPADFPLKQWWDKQWFMSGGNFIYTADGRLSKISPYPIPLHDRTEGKVNYWLAYQLWIDLQGQKYRARYLAWFMRHGNRVMKSADDVLRAYRCAETPRDHALVKLCRMKTQGEPDSVLLTLRFRSQAGVAFQRTYCGVSVKDAYKLAYRDMRAVWKGGAS